MAARSAGRIPLRTRDGIAPPIPLFPVTTLPVDGELEIRKRMNLSLSCDHRVVDGWDAGNFMQDLKKLIENPLKLLSAQ
jgi:hypothetical protein